MNINTIPENLRRICAGERTDLTEKQLAAYKGVCEKIAASGKPTSGTSVSLPSEATAHPADVYRNSHFIPPPRKERVGDELKALLVQLGIADCIPGCDGCTGARARMNAAGVAGCLEQRDALIADLRERSKQVPLTTWATALGKALSSGLAFDRNLWSFDPVASLFDEAIRRARLTSLKPWDAAPKSSELPDSDVLLIPKLSHISHRTGVDLDTLKHVPNLIWQVYPRKETSHVVVAQQRRIRDAMPQFHGVKILVISTDESTDDSVINRSGWDYVLVVQNEPNLREYTGWKQSLDLLKGSPGFTVRLHSKGSWRGTPYQHLARWWQLGYECCLDLDRVYDVLQRHLIAGPFRRLDKPPGWNAPWYYAGSFYAFRNELLDREYTTGTTPASFVPEAYPGIVCNLIESGSLGYEGVQHLYQENAWYEPLKVAPELPTTKQVTPKSELFSLDSYDVDVEDDVKKHLMYHIWLGNSETMCMWNIEELLKRINIFNGVRTIGIAYDNPKDIDRIKAKFVGHRIDNWITNKNSPADGEGTTFYDMLNTLPIDGLTFYGHAKGVKYSQPKPAVKLWTDMQYRICLDQQELVSTALENSLVAGCFMQVFPPALHPVLKKYGDISTEHSWHFAGTFFWFNNREALARHNEIKDIGGYYQIELWPGKLFRVDEASCLFHKIEGAGCGAGPHMYDEVHQESLYLMAANAGVLNRSVFEHYKYVSKLSDKGTWHSYLGFYDRLLEPYKNRAVNLLEIGVREGGSLLLWDRILTHPRSKIIGIDIEDVVSVEFPSRVSLLLGDATKLHSDIPYAPDIVIDDGSHKLDEQVAAFRAYYPLLSPGGLYVIEDIQSDADCAKLRKLFPQLIEEDLRHVKGRYDDRILYVKKPVKYKVPWEDILNTDVTQTSEGLFVELGTQQIRKSICQSCPHFHSTEADSCDLCGTCRLNEMIKLTTAACPDLRW